MQKEELQKFCLEKNILLDSSLQKIFLSFSDGGFIQNLIEKIKSLTNKSFLNKSLIEENKILISRFIDEFSLLKGIDLNELKKEIGLENISGEEVTISPEKKIESKVKVVSSFPCVGRKLEVKDFVNHFRGRYNSFKDILQERGELENLVSIGKIPDEKQKVSIIGMVSKKKVTKNNNVLLDIEDLTGKIKVLVSAKKEKLLKECEDITLDSVIGFKGLGSKDIIFVNEIVFPDTKIDERKKSPIEEYALFIGDLHYGSHNFLEKDFMKFIDYLNGGIPNTPEVEKIKYIFIVGDLITGVGNYPNQEPDLKIVDLEDQFEGIAKLLGEIRKNIKIIISPGNHDCVRIMEPQPLLNEKFAWPLYELPNVIITENPAMVNIGEIDTFPGLNVLTYHGFSFPYYANNIPKLMVEKTMNQPEKIMKYLLKNRHLAPTHTSTQYFPLEKDGLLIHKAPDIFVSGHTHKSGVSYHNNILIISSSSWEGMTPYQEKFGNKPDHCKVPMFNLKTRAVKILDFESTDDGIKTYVEKKKLKIGIDLDDTVWKYFESFLKFYNEKKKKNHKMEEITQYNVGRVLGIEQKEIYDLFHEFNFLETTKDFELFKNAKEFILKLEKNHELFFITARSKIYEEITKEIFKKDFSDKHPIHFITDEEYNVIGTKGTLSKELGLDFFVEDNFENALSCAEQGIKCFLLERPWNKEIKTNHDLIIRVKDWFEIENKFLEIQNE